MDDFAHFGDPEPVYDEVDHRLWLVRVAAGDVDLGHAAFKGLGECGTESHGFIGDYLAHFSWSTPSTIKSRV